MPDWKSLQNTLTQNLLDGNMDQSVTLAQNTIDQGVSPVKFFEECLAPSLARVGDKFDRLDIFLPELMLSAEIAQNINDKVITPAVQANQQDGVESSGKVLLATVREDLHDIGKNMVALMLRVNGFEVIDLGINVDSSEILQAADVQDVDIIGLSCLLTPCLPFMRDVADNLEELGNRGKYHLIIGGAAPSLEYAESIGADGYGETAVEAVRICKELMCK